MAIHFEWYDNPVPPNREDENKVHARITLNGRVGTDYVRRLIQERCSLTETDVSAVLDALSHVLGEQLGDGRQVHLDGIGYFHPTLKCKTAVTRDTKRKNTLVQLKGIKFRADQALKNEVGAVKLENIKHNGHSRKLTPVEIDMRLKEYFKEHQLLTRTDLQSLCGFMKWKAMEELRRLKKEGKLKNIGQLTQPIYVPVPGYYGVSRDPSAR
jgi:predicted histone-like DNA-binding protein